MPSAGEPEGEPQKGEQDCGAAEVKARRGLCTSTLGVVECGGVCEWGGGAETFGPWSRLEADCLCLCLCLCLSRAVQRELRRLAVHLGSLICRRFGTGSLILGGSEPNTFVHTATLDRWPRPCCAEGDNKCRSNMNQRTSTAVSSSDFDVHAPIAPVPCVLCPCVLLLKQIVKPEPDFSTTTDRHSEVRVVEESSIVKVRVSQRGKLEAGTAERLCQACV